MGRREHGSDLVVVEGYPTASRAFYSHPDPEDPHWSRSFDLIFRGVELVSGAQRLHRYDDYVAALAARGYDPEAYASYVDAFRFGVPPHGGLRDRARTVGVAADRRGERPGGLAVPARPPPADSLARQRWSSRRTRDDSRFGYESPMTLIRLVARPMLASMFVFGGINALRNPQRWRMARAGHGEIRGRRQCAQVPVPGRGDARADQRRRPGRRRPGAGHRPLPAAGRRRAGRVAWCPTTLAGHRFWEEKDKTSGQPADDHFFKNVSMLGGLLLAAVDTEGKPGVAWRASHAVGTAKREAKHLRREAKLQARIAAKSLTA